MTRFVFVSSCLSMFLSCFTTNALAQTTVRIVDVGAGLCCVVATADGHYMIYDAGNYRDRGLTAMRAIEEIIPPDSEIDLLVLSHCDADHLAAVPYICENYEVKEIWREGFDPGTDSFRFADEAIDEEVAGGGCVDRNLQDALIGPGFSIPLGGTSTVTFLCGFADIPSEWGLPNGSGENKNARSIVVRLDCGTSSILFGGDTVGRHIGDPWNSLIAAERVLVENSATVSIDVDIVVAPHHGADNGSSAAFIDRTSPEYVIFSAGHFFHHPRFWAANRYVYAGVDTNKMLRTDRGDNEGDTEWLIHGGVSPDAPGDDDVDIVLPATGAVQVHYRTTPFRGGVVPFSLNAADARAIPMQVYSDRIRKYLEADEMWTETHDDLEDHTLGLGSNLALEGMDAGTTIEPGNVPPSTFATPAPMDYRSSVITCRPGPIRSLLSRIRRR